MAEYKMIGTDRMESSLFRRKPDPWEPSKAVHVLPLVRTLFDQLGVKHLEINNPAWETQCVSAIEQLRETEFKLGRARWYD